LYPGFCTASWIYFNVKLQKNIPGPFLACSTATLFESNVLEVMFLIIFSLHWWLFFTYRHCFSCCTKASQMCWQSAFLKELEHCMSWSLHK